MHVAVDDVNFCDDLENVYVKYKSLASIACELPDKYMGFRQLKPWMVAVNSVRLGLL